MLSDDVLVSTVTTTFLLIEWSSPVSVWVYTNGWSNLEDADVHRHSTGNYTYRYATSAKHIYRDRQYYNQTHILRRISLRMKDAYRHERLHKRSALSAKTPYDWSPLHLQARPTKFRWPTKVTTMTIMSTKTTKITMITHNRSPPTIPITFNCNYINGNRGCTWLLLPMDPISAGLPLLPRLWLWASQERKPRLSIFPTGETTSWFETTTSRGATFRALIGASNQLMRYR